jgi:hypothetical protein
MTSLISDYRTFKVRHHANGDDHHVNGDEGYHHPHDCQHDYVILVSYLFSHALTVNDFVTQMHHRRSRCFLNEYFGSILFSRVRSYPH